eukprot:524027-Prymnesium_polylepis.1
MAWRVRISCREGRWFACLRARRRCVSVHIRDSALACPWCPTCKRRVGARSGSGEVHKKCALPCALYYQGVRVGDEVPLRFWGLGALLCAVCEL